MAEPKQLKAIKGGLNITKRLLADTEEAGLTAAQRAEAGRKAAALIKSQPQVKASEALGQQMEKGMKRTTTTQADRTRVGGGNIGGAPFSAISEADPAYAGKVWGVMDSNTAKRLTNLTTPETAWTTMLGSANQLKTNPIVFDKLKRQFIDSMKQGNLSPELESKINHNLALTFGEGAQIRDPKIWRQADTFEKRAALADLMMGQGIPPSKGGVALGGEKSGKGVIFRPTDTLKRETEPSLLHTEHGGDVPTFAAGPRLFRIDKESEYRPDLHPGFPTLLTGKDLEVNMIPTPTEIYLPDWHKQFKKNNPDRKPSYYDLALGVKGEGLPSQDLNDEYIRHLLREGFKDGGEVDQPSLEDRLTKAIANDMAKGGEVNSLESRLTNAIAQHNGMAEGGGAFKKIQFMEKGGKAGKLVSGISKVGKRLMSEEQVASDAIGKAAQSAGMNAPVTATKPLTTMQDFHTSFGDSVRKRAMDMQATMDSLNYKYDKGQRVFTEDSARKNWPPMTVLGRVLEGNRIMREDPTDFLSKKIVDEATGKAKRTPYEAGYKVRLEHAPDNWSEFVIPESAIKGNVDFARGGIAHMDKGGKAGKVVSGLASVRKRLLADAPTESKIIQPPSIIIPSKIGNVKEAARKSGGEYGARRVERAADEVPNLEKLYKEQALKEAFTGDNAKALMTMNPKDFEKFAMPLDARFMDANSTRYTTSGERLPYPEYMSEYLPNVGAFDEMPFLMINKQEQGLPLVPFISGHEGRHRNRVMADKGEKAGLVQLLPRSELREPLPRRSQQEYIEALKEELAMTGNKVKPENYFDNFTQDVVRRKPIDLPDIYAKGGLAMADGGKLIKGLGKIGKRLMADPTTPKTVSAGDIINGMMVRKDIPNTSSIGASLSNYSTHGLQEVPMSAFQTVGKPKYYSAQEEKRTKELARQIQENKELNPLIVVKDAEGHYILEGGHRFDALRELGIESFPALMVHDLESLAKQLLVSPVTKAHGGLAMAGGGSIQDNLKKIQNYSVLDQGAPRKPNELGGVVLAGASWMAGDEKTKLAKQLFGEEVTNTAIGGQKTSDVLKQLNEFKGNGGTFAPNTTVVLDIGANDIAQGVDESVIRDNLNEIVSRLGDEGVHVILSGQPEAHSYDEAIKSTNLHMDDLYSDIAANNPNVTLVDAMSGMLNDKSLMDESGFHLNSDEAKLAYLSQFANAYKGIDTTNQGVIDIPKQIEEITQTGNFTDIPQSVVNIPQSVVNIPQDVVYIPEEIAQITQTDKPAERYTPESQIDFMPAVVESEPSAGYIYAQNNSGIDNYYNVINDYLAQERTQDEIQAAMEQYGVSQADIDAARDYQPSGGRFDESYATEAYANGGSAFKKIQFMDKGGITTSAGSFSPEELGVTANDLRVMDEKTWNTIKRNAPATYEWAKQNVKDEANQLKTAKGMKDFALRVGASYAGAIPDFANLLLMAPDAVFGTELASEKPWFGSQQYLDAMNKAGMLGENEFPIAETVAGILTPAGLIKKGVKKVGNMRTSKETPKKRQGGLTAMAR
jgi:hypothetical protein